MALYTFKSSYIACRVVEALVEKNADCVRWRNDENQTPLHSVCFDVVSHNVQIAKFLIEKGAKADINEP
jgi:ankyrin repeat protein